jgi:hypothetical protein
VGSILSTACPLETAITLVHTGNFVIFDQNGWPVDPFEIFDGKRVWAIPVVIAIIRCKYSRHDKSPLKNLIIKDISQNF